MLFLIINSLHFQNDLFLVKCTESVLHLKIATNFMWRTLNCFLYSSAFKFVGLCVGPACRGILKIILTTRIRYQMSTITVLNTVFFYSRNY